MSLKSFENVIKSFEIRLKIKVKFLINIMKKKIMKISQIYILIPKSFPGILTKVFKILEKNDRKFLEF